MRKALHMLVLLFMAAPLTLSLGCDTREEGVMEGEAYQEGVGDEGLGDEGILGDDEGLGEDEGLIENDGLGEEETVEEVEVE